MTNQERIEQAAVCREIGARTGGDILIGVVGPVRTGKSTLIKQFMDWCVEGASTYPLRRELLEKQKETVEAEIAHMNKFLDMLRFKCWYYEQSIKDGSEDTIPAMIPNNLPEDIRRAYENSHKE